MNFERDIVTAARKYIGVRWHHQGRTRNVGLDCAGIFVVSAADIGITVEDFLQYNRDLDSNRLESMLQKYLYRIPPEEAVHGNLLGFSNADRSKIKHLAFKTDRGILHAKYRRDGTGKVVEEPMSATLKKRLHSAWRRR